MGLTKQQQFEEMEREHAERLKELEKLYSDSDDVELDEEFYRQLEKND